MKLRYQLPLAPPPEDEPPPNELLPEELSDFRGISRVTE